MGVDLLAFVLLTAIPTRQISEPARQPPAAHRRQSRALLAAPVFFLTYINACANKKSVAATPTAAFAAAYNYAIIEFDAQNIEGDIQLFTKLNILF